MAIGCRLITGPTERNILDRMGVKLFSLEQMKQGYRIADMTSVGVSLRDAYAKDGMSVKESDAYKNSVKFLTDVGNILADKYKLPELKNSVSRKLAKENISKIADLVINGNELSYLNYFDHNRFMMMLENRNVASEMFGVTIPEKDFVLYQKTMKSVAGVDTKNNLLMSVLHVLGRHTLYIAGQTVRSSGLAALTVMNVLGFTTEKMIANVNSFTSKQLSEFRKKYNIMSAEADAALNEPGLIAALKRYFEKIKEVFAAGAYNAIDIISESSIKNNMVDKAIQYVLGMNDMKAVYNYLDRLSNEERLSIIGEIHSVAERMYNSRTGSFQRTKDGKRVFHTGIEEGAYFAYGHMAGRGSSLQRGILQTFKEAQLGKLMFNDIGQLYREKVFNEGKDVADSWIKDFMVKNENSLLLFKKINLGLLLGAKLSRVLEAQDDDEGFLNNLKDAVMVGQSFVFPLQTLQSTPRGREIIAYLDGSMRDIDHDGQYTWVDKEAGEIMFVERLLSDISRRFVPVKVLARYMGQEEKNFSNIIKDIVDHWMDATSGYMYYLAEDVIESGFDMELPKDHNLMLKRTLGMDEGWLDKYRNLKLDKRLEMLIKDTPNRIGTWLAYRIPFVKDYNIAGFINDYNFVADVQQLNTKDKNYDAMLGGKVQWLDETMGKYAFDLLTQGTVSRLNKPGQRYEDLRKNYGQGLTSQEKDDVFVNFLGEALGENNFEKVKQAFAEQDPYGKQLARFGLMLEANKPGAGKEMISFFANQEYFDTTRAMGRRDLYKTDEALDNKIKAEVGKKYGEALFVVDKPAYSNLLLYYMKNKYPDTLGKHITYGLDKGGNERTAPAGMSAMGLKVDEKKNTLLTNLYLLDMYSKIAIHEGNPSGYMIANAFAKLRQPTYTDFQSPAYNEIMFSGVNGILDDINNSKLTQLEKTTMKMGIVMNMKGKRMAVAKNPEIRSKLGSTWEDSMKFLFGTLKETTDIVKAVQERAMNPIDSIADGTTYSNTLGNNYKNYYNSNKSLLQQAPDIIDTFKSFRPKYGYSQPSYKKSKYGRDDRDYLQERGKAIDSMNRMGNYGGKKKGGFKKEELVGRSPQQKPGDATRGVRAILGKIKTGAKKKPKEWKKVEGKRVKSTDRKSLKGKRIMSGVKKYNSDFKRKRSNRGPLVGSSQGGNRNSSVSGSKRRNNAGSKSNN